MKKTTKLKKLMESYCQKTGNSLKSVRFIYDEDNINENDTPESKKMENDCEINVIMEQLGGF